MRSFDYVVKRIAFAFVTIFVAITLNFVIFRAAPGDATTALRCLSCTDEVRAQVRTELGLDKSTFAAVRHLPQGPRARRLRALVPEPPAGAATALAAAREHAADAAARHVLLDRRSASPPGVIAAWRRGTWSEKASVWVGLAFFSLPTQWLGIMLILYFAGPLGLPTHGISDPYLSFTNPEPVGASSATA